MSEFILKSRNSLGVCLFLLDSLVLGGLFYLFTMARHQFLVPLDGFFETMLIPIGTTWFLFYIINAYSHKTDMLSLSYTTQHVIACITALSLTVIGIYSFYFDSQGPFSRSVLPLSFASFLVCSLIYRRQIYQWTFDKLQERHFLILGAGKLAQRLYKDCMDSNIPQNIRIVDLSGENEGQHICGIDSPRIECNSIEQLVSPKLDYDAVILADDRRGMDKELTKKLIELHFSQTHVFSLETFYEEYFQKIPSFILSPQLLLQKGFHLARRPIYQNIKRMSDVLFALCGLTLTLPLLALIPILIRLDSKGPAIFKQTRLGKSNIPFMIYKFRTMKNGKKKGDKYVRKDDDRLTRIGKCLRLSRLDELPQLWNVLKGDMSLIGPRAEWAELTQFYEKEILYYHFRHFVKPGITGWLK